MKGRMRAKIPTRYVKASVFQAASQERLKDAQCLHEAGRFQGAIYLCGYALECYLKSCYCSAQKIARIEEREAKHLGHELVELLDAAGLSIRLAEQEDLYISFHRISKSWSTDIRYSGVIRSRGESESFLRDAKWLLLWLRKESRS